MLRPGLPALLQALTPVETVHGAGLLVSDVETAVKQLTGVETISTWQLENLIATGPVGQMLVRLGYRTSITMNPEQPFYLLDNGRQPIPSLFYPMLNKALALPLLPDWSD